MIGGGQCARSSRNWRCEVAYLVGFSCGAALCLLLYWCMFRADSLPNDVESLKKLLHAARDQVQSLSAQLHSRNVLIEQMKLQLAQLKRM